MNKIAKELWTRAAIRKQILTRKSGSEGKPDRIAELLENAAQEITRLELLRVIYDRRFELLLAEVALWRQMGRSLYDVGLRVVDVSNVKATGWPQMTNDK